MARGEGSGPLARLRGLLGDDGPPAGAGRPELEDVLLAGETVAASLPVPDGRVVVTSHRVIAFTPDGDGRTIDHVDRPNVADVTLTASGWSRPLSPALRAGIVGVVCVWVGLSLSLEGALGGVSSPESDAGGLGAILALLGFVRRALALLDDLFLAVGVLALAGAALGVGAWLVSRSPVLVIERAGEDAEDISVDADGVDEEAVRQLRTAVRYD